MLACRKVIPPGTSWEQVFNTSEQEEASVDTASAQMLTLSVVSSLLPEGWGVTQRKPSPRVFLLSPPWLVLLCRLRSDYVCSAARSEHLAISPTVKAYPEASHRHALIQRSSTAASQAFPPVRILFTRT